MSETDSDQPKKKSWFAKHKILTVLGILIVLGIIGSAAGGGGKNAATTSSPTPAPTPMVVDTKVFADDFDANQVAAEAKYKGKLVQLTATISNITDSGLQFQNVSSKQFDLTQIACNIKNKDDLLAVKNGQSVTFAGTVDGQTIGVITLKDCSIVK